MQKFRIHPLSVLLILILFLAGKGQEVAVGFVTLLLHECGHFFCAKQRGYLLHSFSLMPYGAVMYAENGLPDRDAFWIALFGPLSNLLFLLFTVLWWFFPSIYTATYPFFVSSLSLGLFNLLPCYPLDGGRILLSLVPNKKRCLRFLRFSGYFFSAVCLLLFIVSLWFRPVYYLPFLSVMFFWGSKEDAKKENYRLLVSDMFFLTKQGEAVDVKSIFADASLSIEKAVKKFHSSYYYILYVSYNGKVRTLQGADLEKLYFFDRKKTLGDFLTFYDAESRNTSL